MEVTTDRTVELRGEEESEDSGESSNNSECTTGGAKRLRKRRRLRYNAAYHELLQITVQEINSGSVEAGDAGLEPSQVGLTCWSPEEKAKLFKMLSRCGKDDLKAIAEAIGSKSEPEVHVYLQLLQQKTDLQYLQGDDSRIVDFADLPASFEISEACSGVLGAATDAILAKEQELDEEQERQVFGDFWLLDAPLVKLLKDSAADDGPSIIPSEHPQLQHALELLDLEKWLHLSSRIFMNPCDLTNNWRSYVDKGETPSIYASAFHEFHNLVVTVTKRLVSSAIFFAKSRLRTTKTKKHGHQNYVRQEDVLAAVDVLGMELDAIKFWHGAARRCGLDVYEGVMARKCVGKYSYEEVEAILMQPECMASSVPRSTSGELASLSDGEASSTEVTDSESDDDGISDANGTHEDEETRISRSAEALDLQASREEEQRLWNLFPQILKRPPQDESDHDLSKRQRLSSVLRNTASNWRDCVDYQRPWQRYSSPVPTASFARNRKVHRRKPIPEHSSNTEDLWEDTHHARKQDAAGPPRFKQLDGPMDNSTSDVDGVEAASEAGSDGDEEQAEGGLQSSASEVENDLPSSAQRDSEMKDADSENEGHQQRGRTVKRSWSARASTTHENTSERTSSVAGDTDDGREDMSASESGREDD